MPKYLFTGSLGAEGARALLQGGATAWRAAVEGAARSLGGTLEAYYLAFGADDFVAITELPDNQAAAALSLRAAAGGGPHLRTVVLLTPEEADEAARRQLSYPAPGR